MQFNLPYFNYRLMTKLLTEINALIKFALPVSLAQLATMGMSATDVLIAGQAGSVELAGMNLGANTWNLIILFFMGVGFATQPLIAKQFGAQNDSGVKHQIHQSLWMCFGLGLVATLTVLFVAWAMQFVAFDEQMRSIARQYLFVISASALPLTMTAGLRGSLEGMSLTKVVFLVNFAAFLINIPLDYALVHGLWGLPRLGGVGCALASAILIWISFLMFFLILKCHQKLRTKALLTNFEKPDVKAIRKTMKIGLPISISIIIEMSLFSGSGIFIAKFGPIETGAHAVALTIASMSFMLYMGIGQGITIRAAQLFGAGNMVHAWYAIKVGVLLNLISSTLICLVFLFVPHWLVSLFSDDVALIPLAVTLLYFGAAFQIVDSLQVSAVFGLRAYQDTASPPKYQFVAFWLFGLPIGVGLALYGESIGLDGAKGMWAAMVLSLFVVGVLLLRRLNRVAHEKISA